MLVFSSCGASVRFLTRCDGKLREPFEEGIDAAIYNLGFLPGGDKGITTMTNSTLKSVESVLNLLNSGGILIIAVYVGHEEGAKEGEALLKYTKELPKNTQSCPTLCDPMNCSTQGLPVHHNSWNLLKLMPIESVMPSNHLILCHPLLLLSSIFSNISVFQRVSSTHQVAKVLELQLQSFQ